MIYFELLLRIYSCFGSLLCNIYASVLQFYVVVLILNDPHASSTMMYFEVLMLEVAPAKPFPARYRKFSPMYVTSLQALRNAEKLISTKSQDQTVKIEKGDIFS